ncbi:MAG: hypothetical protein HOP33_14065 [Verrucomicrobia bacterium]|nr:hypothetical protein [Verrucomicrobiota bacterium]
MSAWDLFMSERFADAISAFSKELRDAPSTFEFNNRGMAYLHLGEFGAALKDFQAADALSGADLQTECDGALCGVALWMARREREALRTWIDGVSTSFAGKVRYGDAAGGVTIGNLLMFGGIRLDDEAARTLATRYLKKRLRTKQSSAWPGAASRYLLGTVTEDEMLAAAASVPILHERQNCQAHFYIAVRKLSTKDKTGYFSSMQKAFELGRRAKLGAEYYLALHESGQQHRS